MSDIEWIDIDPTDFDRTAASVLTGTIRVSKYPVTVSQFRAFMDADGYLVREYWSDQGWEWNCDWEKRKKGPRGRRQPLFWERSGYNDPDFPVTGVSYWEAEAFAKFCDARLPAEDEWYFFASNGGKTAYPWGDEFDPGLPRAHLSFFGQLDADGDARVVSVKSFPAGQTESGIWDLLGNVSEWCDSCESNVAPEYAVLRGGCSWHTPFAVTSRFRDVVYRNARDNQTGIRLVKGAKATIKIRRIAEKIRRPPGMASELKRPTRPFRQEGIPDVNEDQWALAVTGPLAGGNQAIFRMADLREMPAVEMTDLFVCVCRWADVTKVKGVLLKDLVERVGLRRSSLPFFVRQSSIPGPSGVRYQSDIPLHDALAHNALLCHEMNDAKLTPELGAPLRLIDFSLYGYKQVKCLAKLEFVDTYRMGFWEEKAGYEPTGKIQSGRVTVVGKRPGYLDL